MNSDANGFLSGYLLDRQGGYREVGPEAIRNWSPSEGLLWINLEGGAEGSRVWLRDESGLAPLACEALLREDARPRTLVQDDSVLAVLRGVNLNPGAVPEDMVALQLWVEEHRVIDLRDRRLRFVSDVRDQLAAVVESNAPAKFVLMTPYSGMDNRIALTAWGTLDTLDQFDGERVQAFIDSFQRKFNPEGF